MEAKLICLFLNGHARSLPCFKPSFEFKYLIIPFFAEDNGSLCATYARAAIHKNGFVLKAR